MFKKKLNKNWKKRLKKAILGVVIPKSGSIIKWKFKIPASDSSNSNSNFHSRIRRHSCAFIACDRSRLISAFALFTPAMILVPRGLALCRNAIYVYSDVPQAVLRHNKKRIKPWPVRKIRFHNLISFLSNK